MPQRYLMPQKEHKALKDELGQCVIQTMFARVKRKFQAPRDEMPVIRGQSPRVTGISSQGA